MTPYFAYFRFNVVQQLWRHLTEFLTKPPLHPVKIQGIAGKQKVGYGIFTRESPPNNLYVRRFDYDNDDLFG